MCSHRRSLPHRSRALRLLTPLGLALAVFNLAQLGAGAAEESQPRFLDLSLLVAPGYPCTWPSGFPPFLINAYQQIGPASAYNSDVLALDENTGTQFDAPTHSVAPPSSGKPNAGPFGTMSSDKVPAWEFCGEACVIDCRDLIGAAPSGHSPLVKKDRVIAWEQAHRPLHCGDVVLFHSGYTDRFYAPLPAGLQFIADPVNGKSPAWPDPDAECMEYLATRGVMTLGTDSASMGPIPAPQAEETHYAGLRHGMIWTESATGLGALPVTGAFYATIGPKHAGGIGGPVRAFAVAGGPLSHWLIEAARQRRVADLSVLLDDDLPVWSPGPGVGQSRYPYLSHTLPAFNQSIHLMDSHIGTHLVPPSYALPLEGFDDKSYAPEVEQWLTEYEQRYGKRGTSAVTAERVPLAQTCGWARVIDVRRRIGTTDKAHWPASPEITGDDIRADEKQHGAIRPGDIVIFRSAYSDTYLQPFPQGTACLADPLNGLREGWPAPGPDAVVYLADKGVRCVATDAPTLGGVEPKRALWTYWALGSHGMVGVEYLTHIGRLPDKAFFLFAPLKVGGCHGGPGRAIALY